MEREKRLLYTLSKPFPVRSMWVYALVAGSLFLMALLWFIFHSIFWFIQPAAFNIAVSLGTNGTQYLQVDSFFQVVDNWALIVCLIALLIFVLVYSQKKGVEV